MLEVAADLVPAGSVLYVVGEDFDRSAILLQAEMVRGLLMGEAHFVVAALIHLRGMIVLGEGESTGEQEGTDEDFHIARTCPAGFRLTLR